MVGEFGLQFYAAAPSRTRGEHSIGILSVIDRKPRDISVSGKKFLRRMAALVIGLIEPHLTVNRLFTLIASLTNDALRSVSLTADKQLLLVLAENLAKALNVHYIFIGEYDERGTRLPATFAFYHAGAVKGKEQDCYRATH